MEEEKLLSELEDLTAERKQVEAMTEEDVLKNFETDSKRDYLEALDEEIEYYRSSLRDKGYNQWLEPMNDC